jgi:hypothetical protein
MSNPRNHAEVEAHLTAIVKLLEERGDDPEHTALAAPAARVVARVFPEYFRAVYAERELDTPPKIMLSAVESLTLNILAHAIRSCVRQDARAYVATDFCACLHRDLLDALSERQVDGFASLKVPQTWGA